MFNNEEPDFFEGVILTVELDVERTDDKPLLDERELDSFREDFEVVDLELLVVADGETESLFCADTFRVLELLGELLVFVDRLLVLVLFNLPASSVSVVVTTL